MVFFDMQKAFLLFVIYINDVANCISGGSKINLFADDIALYRIITSHDDYSVLQLDVNSIDSCLSAKHLTSGVSSMELRVLEHPPQLWHNSQLSTSAQILSMIIDNWQLVPGQ